MAIKIKTAEDIAGLRVAGRLASELLDYLTPFVKPGDLWTLGRHRMLCGDATNADDVARSLGV